MNPENTWSFVPQAQLIYSKSKFDNTVDSEGVALSVDDGKSLEGRIGVAFEGHTADNSFGYFRLNLIEEFEGKNTITAAGTGFSTSVHGTSGEMSAGGSFIVRPGVRLYTDITGRVGFSNGVASARGTAGVKVNWWTNHQKARNPPTGCKAIRALARRLPYRHHV